MVTFLKFTFTMTCQNRLGYKSFKYGPNVWENLRHPQVLEAEQIDECYAKIVIILRREYGVNKLPLGTYQYRTFYDELRIFFDETTEVDKALDVVELVCQSIDKITYPSHLLSPIDELNQRFKERGVGYGFESGQIIRIDEELIHEEVVKPALRILNQPQFAGAQEEFLKAHEQYRKGDTKDSLSNCLKAFEVS